jgi:hypothetical protein
MTAGMRRFLIMLCTHAWEVSQVQVGKDTGINSIAWDVAVRIILEQTLVRLPVDPKANDPFKFAGATAETSLCVAAAVITCCISSGVVESRSGHVSRRICTTCPSDHKTGK